MPPDQDRKTSVTYIDGIRDSVDEHIVKALRNKINLAGRSLGEQMRECREYKGLTGIPWRW